MVKITIVGRMSDGLPLAQGLRYMNEEYAYLSCYKQQAQFILQEISRGALTASKMTIHVNNFCFKYPSLSIFVQFFQFVSKFVLVLISMKLQFSVMHHILHSRVPFITG
ncbi:vesicle transport protein SEC22 [Vigna unguiculata]|uniref:Vesicle transport protein SEC22 n=1 Tax=Vigna unguiculata TaxID=3917 RepID=A0A4D6N360_VIGUN|nr:vesicle transport protein SEC22 [Vigna unguiculata]